MPLTNLQTLAQSYMSAGKGIIIPGLDASGNPADVGGNSVTVTAAGTPVYHRAPLAFEDTYSLGCAGTGYFTAPDSANTHAASGILSAVLMLKLTALGVYHMLLSKNDDGDYEFRINSVSNKLELNVASALQLTGNTALTTNLIQFVGFTAGTGNPTVIYYNGVADGSSAAVTIPTSATVLGIGARAAGTFKCNGDIAEICVLPGVALSAAQHLALYRRAMTVPTFPAAADVLSTATPYGYTGSLITGTASAGGSGAARGRTIGGV